MIMANNNIIWEEGTKMTLLVKAEKKIKLGKNIPKLGKNVTRKKNLGKNVIGKFVLGKNVVG